MSSLLARPKQLAFMLHQNGAKLKTFETNALFLISSFGSNDISDKQKLAQLANLKNDPAVESITVKDNTLTITKKDGTIIESTILSNTFGWLDSDESLKTSKRSKLSHQKSMMIAKHLPFESTLVTGRVCGLTSKS